MARLLQRRCPRKHVHQPLVSGRCAAAAFYPLKPVRALIKGIADTKAADSRRSNKINALIKDVGDYEVEGKILSVVDTNSGVRSNVNKIGGGKIEITFDPANFKEVYRDE